MPVQPPPRIPPWHDILTGRRPPREVTAVIEIPTNERNKYQLDKALAFIASTGYCTVQCTTLETTGSCLAPWARTATRWTCSSS